MTRVYNHDGDIIIEGEGGRIIGSFGMRPALLLPEESWLNIPVSITFPDLIKRSAYGYSRGSSEPFPGLILYSDGCMTVTTFPAQEWGPNGVGDGTFANDLSEAVLGSVPAGVNYLDVRLFLTRTKAPSRYCGHSAKPSAGFEIPTLLSSNQVLAEGGSALVEAIGPLRRAIWIGRKGTDVVLRRYQSVNEPNAVQYPTTWVTGSDTIGWSHHGGSGSDKPNFAWVNQEKLGSNNDGARPRARSGSDACSLTDTSDFSSTYSGTVIIRPGYIAP